MSQDTHLDPADHEFSKPVTTEAEAIARLARIIGTLAVWIPELGQHNMTLLVEWMEVVCDSMKAMPPRGPLPLKPENYPIEVGAARFICQAVEVCRTIQMKYDMCPSCGVPHPRACRPDCRLEATIDDGLEWFKSLAPKKEPSPPPDPINQPGPE